jgi:GrpB-like predicted nucleotidyltransferase (UPF0157 family)
VQRSCSRIMIRTGQNAINTRSAASHTLLAIAWSLLSISAARLCLGAKPIIDIMVAVRSLERDLPACIEPLRRLGYEHVERTDFTDSCFFCHGAWGPSTRHLHITEYGSAFWNEKLLFRDFLRLHNDTADEYFALKRSLAAKHATNRTAYTDAKSSYIHGVVSRARATTLGPSIANRIDRRAHK